MNAPVPELLPAAQAPLPLSVSGDTQRNYPAVLLEMAISKGADLDRLERLMETQIRWEERQALQAYTVAMASFKAESLAIYKDKHVRFENRSGGLTEYDHATLGAVVAVVAPALARHGLFHRWKVDQDAAGIAVECVITHNQGHSESVTQRAPADQSGGKNTIQSIGSTVTYLQRYTLLSITGLATYDQDDDGYGSAASSDSQELGRGQDKPQGSSPERVPYPDEQLLANSKEWKALFQAGRANPESLITRISQRFTLTDHQQQQIRDLAA